jgi:hypothetical protein
MNGNGQIVVWLGAATGISSARQWVYTFSEDGFGMRVSSAGDLNGDGLSEVVAGYPYAHPDLSGEVNLHYGGAEFSQTPDAIPQIPVLRTAGGNPIALRGLTADPDGVAMSAVGRTAAGRTRVRLECQLALSGQPFPAVESGPVTDSGPAGAPPALALMLPVIPDSRHRWRMRVATANPFFPHGHWMTSSPTVPSLYAFRSAENVSAAPDPFDAAGNALLSLESVAPNPSAGRLVAAFSLARGGPTRVDILDVAGRRVATLVDWRLPAGNHRVPWDGAGESGRPVPAGVYFVRVATGGAAVGAKVMRVR